MKKTGVLLDSLLYSNIFIGICALALTFTNQLTVDGMVQMDSTCWFIFFSTIFTYSFFKFRDGKRGMSNTPHQHWAVNYPQLSRNILLISLIATICFFLMLTFKMKLLVGILAVITCFYGYLPVPFTSPRIKLRDLGLLKTIFVAMVWSVTTVAVPLADSHVETDVFVFLLLRRFLFVLGLTMAFEIKDMENDKEHHITTLPIAIGVVNTRLFAQAVLFALMCIITVQYFFFGLSLYNMLAVDLSLLLSIICIQPLNESTSEKWYYLVMDGMMIVQFIFVYVAVKFLE